MSIHIPLDNLSETEKKIILEKLTVITPRGALENIVQVDEFKNEVHLPIGFAVEECKRKPRKRDQFTTRTLEFNATLRPYQKEHKKNIIERLNKYGCCVLSLHVGWGKSIFSIYLATRLGLKTIILANRLVLLKQWKELLQCTCPNSKIQLLSAKSTPDHDTDFYLVNPINIPKLGWNAFTDVGTLICDEIHLLCSKNLYKGLYYIQPRYTIGLSATPYRPDGLDNLLKFFYGTFQVHVPLKRKHTVYRVETGIKINYTLNMDGRMDWNSVLNGQAENEVRNRMIIKIILDYPLRNFLVLCKRVEHGHTLARLLGEARVNVTCMLGSKTDFDTDARVLIATCQKCGVGFSFDKLDALIVASDMEEYFIQYLGRVFRTPEVEPIVFDLVDDLPILRKHFQTRRKIYKSCGGTLEKIVG